MSLYDLVYYLTKHIHLISYYGVFKMLFCYFSIVLSKIELNIVAIRSLETFEYFKKAKFSVLKKKKKKLN
jgi:hypothetical protein